MKSLCPRCGEPKGFYANVCMACFKERRDAAAWTIEDFRWQRDHALMVIPTGPGYVNLAEIAE